MLPIKLGANGAPTKRAAAKKPAHIMHHASSKDQDPTYGFKCAPGAACSDSHCMPTRDCKCHHCSHRLITTLWSKKTVDPLHNIARQLQAGETSQGGLPQDPPPPGGLTPVVGRHCWFFPGEGQLWAAVAGKSRLCKAGKASTPSEDIYIGHLIFIFHRQVMHPLHMQQEPYRCYTIPWPPRGQCCCRLPLRKDPEALVGFYLPSLLLHPPHPP